MNLIILMSLGDNIPEYLGKAFDMLLFLCLPIGGILILIGLSSLGGKNRSFGKAVIFIGIGGVMIWASIQYGSLWTPIFSKGGSLSF